MLRVEVSESNAHCTLIVEGGIEGVYTVELETFWRNLACRNSKAVIVDFRGVLRVDQKGKRLLRSMYLNGVSFVGARLAIQDTLDEISSPRSIDN